MPRWLLWSWVLLASVAGADDGPPRQEVRYPAMESAQDQRDSYPLALLQLALDKSSEEFGDYELTPAPDHATATRALMELRPGGSLDVLWTMTTAEREAMARPIRIPIHKGLLGYRLLVVRSEDAPWFAAANDLTPLRTVLAGLGHDWPDREIFDANQLPALPVGNYEALFYMLQQGRFDYLSRGMLEAWAELDHRRELDLKVADRLLLYFRVANYFFVDPSDERLAQRIELGLEQALADGSFDELFYNYPEHQQAFALTRAAERQLLQLDNPLLPTMPVERPELWYYPERQPLPAP